MCTTVLRDAQIKHALAALRADCSAQLAYRAAAGANDSRSSDGAVNRLAKALTRAAAARGDLLSALADLSEHGSPQPGEKGARFATLGRPERDDERGTAIARSTVADAPPAPPHAVTPQR